MKLHFMFISMSSRALCGVCCTKKEKVCFTFPDVLRKYTTSSVICFNPAFSGSTLTMLGIFMLLFTVAMPLHAQSPDSVCVFRYPPSGEKLSLKRDDNSRQLSLLDVQMQTFRPGKDTLRMDFYSGDVFFQWGVHRLSNGRSRGQPYKTPVGRNVSGESGGRNLQGYQMNTRTLFFAE